VLYIEEGSKYISPKKRKRKKRCEIRRNIMKNKKHKNLLGSKTLPPFCGG
jgi:hypothetical protein